MSNRKKSFPVWVEVSISAEQIANSLSHDELVQFIKDLDLEAQAWSVTLPLCDHFAALKKEHEAEETADACGGPAFFNKGGR